MKTKFEQYVSDAVKAEAKNFRKTTVSNCHIEMPVNVGDAIKYVAQALQTQAEANQTTAYALKTLCLKMGEVNATAINIEG